ncbi:MAG: dUTP diphosphatase [Alphaproteobacteria bacterium]|nr:dUTP diphosphatase [Alphaproteobacteria bacterium]
MTTGPLVIPCMRLPGAEGIHPPLQATPGSAGHDMHAAEDAVIEPGAFRAIATGYAIAIPDGYEGQVRPRSGLAARHGVTVLNAPGTIDADYRGEVKVILVNHGRDPFTLKRNDRIAQLVIAPVTTSVFEPAAHLPETRRGGGGFGSTGMRPKDER